MSVEYYIVKAIHKVFKLNTMRGSRISRTARLCYDIQMVNSEIGNYSYIGEHSVVIETKIGNFCSIADGCIIGGPAHDYHLVSTSPVFTAGRNILRKNFSTIKITEYKQTTIGNDVWIGSRCLIKAGVTVGNGAVIGMGSVITKDIGPYEIWAGNPAKLIKKRFDEHIISELLRSAWWNASDVELEKIAALFDDPRRLIAKLDEDSG